MSLKLPLPLRGSLSAGLVLAVVVGGAAALLPSRSAVAAGPFQPFVGNWTGGGQIIGSNGVPERIRCEREANRGEALSQTIVCASASYRLDIQIYVEASGQTVQGYWRETTRNVSGQLTGRIQGGLFEGAVMGQGFTAGISLRSNGRRQTVNIAPSGGDIANVRIELERRG